MTTAPANTPDIAGGQVNDAAPADDLPSIITDHSTPQPRQTDPVMSPGAETDAAPKGEDDTAPRKSARDEIAEQAIDAMRALIELPPVPENAPGIMVLQSDIKRHRDLVQWMSDVGEQGREAWMRLSEEERETIASVMDKEKDA